MTGKSNPLILIFLILALSVLIIGGVSLTSLQHIGYLTGTQGLEAQFHSVYFENGWWSHNESRQLSGRGSPSSLSFGYSLNFDPDDSSDWMPNLCGSQQPITMDADIEPKTYSWNYKVESDKTLSNGTIVDVFKQFELFRYRCSWSINIWLSGPEAETGFRSIFIYHPNYGDSKIWIKLVPRSFVYFAENPDQVFFAPAYIGLADNVEWVGLDHEGKTIQNDADIEASQDLIPEAKGETVGIYYERGGGEVFTEDTLLQYQGTTLDAEIFRDEYWMRVDLVNFEPLRWSDIWGHKWKYPSAHLNFIVDLWVLGEWTVYYKTGEIPELDPHVPVVHVGTPLDWWLDWFTSPWTWLGIGTSLIFLVIFLFIILAVTGSGTVLGGLFSGRKRGNRG